MRTRRTRTPARIWGLRLDRGDRELLFRAALRADVSQSEFLRVALRERAARVLRDGVDLSEPREATA